MADGFAPLRARTAALRRRAAGDGSSAAKESAAKEELAALRRGVAVSPPKAVNLALLSQPLSPHGEQCHSRPRGSRRCEGATSLVHPWHIHGAPSSHLKIGGDAITPHCVSHGMHECIPYHPLRASLDDRRKVEGYFIEGEHSHTHKAP